MEHALRTTIAEEIGSQPETVRAIHNGLGRLLLRAALVWLAIAVAMVLNGTVRDLFYQPLVGYEWGHAISSVTGVAIILVAGYLFVCSRPEVPRGRWVAVGVFWLLLTAGFEFGLGAASGAGWEQMLADYSIARGRLWSFVLLATLFAPSLWGRWLTRAAPNVPAESGMALPRHKGSEPVSPRSSVAVWILAAALLFLAVGALYGGTLLLLDPSGRGIGLPLELLAGSIFADYTVPGLVLLVVLGLAPIPIALGLLAAPRRPVLFGYGWPWPTALAVVLGLVVWLAVQVATVGYHGGIQTVYCSFALGLVLLVLLPAVRSQYRHHS